MSVAANVARKVKRLPKGRSFPLASFLDCGSESAVRTALSRLVKKGNLANLARGVYARPKPNRFFGTSLPGPEEAALTIARATGEHLAPHGAEIALLALHYLGRQRTTTDLLRDLTKLVPAADLLSEKGAPIWLRDRINELDVDPRAA